MRKILCAAVMSISILFGSGCANVNPRNDEKIDNQGGKIDEIKNNQNGIMADIGKLKQDQQLNNSQMKDMQNGYLNLKSQMFNQDNSGVQILQGGGPLFMIFGTALVALVLWFYRSMAKRHEQTANILAQQIAHHQNDELNEKVFSAAMHTNVEKDVYKLMTKYKKSV